MRKSRINFNRVERNSLISEEIEIELVRKLKRYYGIRCFDKFYEIGKLDD